MGIYIFIVGRGERGRYQAEEGAREGERGPFRGQNFCRLEEGCPGVGGGRVGGRGWSERGTRWEAAPPPKKKKKTIFLRYPGGQWKMIRKAIVETKLYVEGQLDTCPQVTWHSGEFVSIT